MFNFDELLSVLWQIGSYYIFLWSFHRCPIVFTCIMPFMKKTKSDYIIFCRESQKTLAQASFTATSIFSLLSSCLRQSPVLSGDVSISSTRPTEGCLQRSDIEHSHHHS